MHAIASVSYTSVLQRTFNLNVTTLPAASASRIDALAEDGALEFEFAMLDQADFAGIDAYVKRHGLQDASLAEGRRAKRVGVNGAKGGEDNGEGGEAEGELERARREVVAREGGGGEEEDEGEEGEDYDPGSEGESEGSGTSSEEEEEGEAAGDRMCEGHEGLVGDELRSGGDEAEEEL